MTQGADAPKPEKKEAKVAINPQRALELGTKLSLVLAALGLSKREQRATIDAESAGQLAAQVWTGMVDAKGEPLMRPVEFEGDVEIAFRVVPTQSPETGLVHTPVAGELQ